MRVATFSYHKLWKPCVLTLLFVALVMLAFRAESHEISTAYLRIAYADNQANNSADLSGENRIENSGDSPANNNPLGGELVLQPYDLELAIGIDSNLDGQLRWGELVQNYPDIIAYLKEHLVISSATEPCAVQFNPSPALSTMAGNNAIRIGFTTTCSSPDTLRYSGFFAVDSAHKALVSVGKNDNLKNYVISGPEETISLQGENSFGITVGHFVYQGILHILIGIDHILFLFATLLTVNLVRHAGQWQGRAAQSAIIKDTLVLVTAFTLAHSLTLTVTALGWIVPNGRWVETGIALSVLFTAFNNIWPLVTRLGWLTFGFGLLHGMGFASVFGELTQQSESSLLSIASFNVGVELGQLAIVLLLMPVLILLRKAAWYTKIGMPLCSALIGIIAMNWAWQRW